jgi:flagellin
MSVVINTNASANSAANNLSASSMNLQRSLNRLSSGSKIINPSDDAGGLAVSLKLTATAKRQGATLTVLGNQISQLQTQDGALKVAGKILERMSELTALAADTTKTSTDTGNYQSEFASLRTQIGSIVNEKFNGIAMFGTGANQADLGGATTTALSTLDISTAASTADTAVQTAIIDVAKLRATNGANQSNVGFQSELLTVNKANLEAANSRIVDVDVAEESTQLAKWNVLVQSGTAMLAQANQSAQSALKLLG